MGRFIQCPSQPEIEEFDIVLGCDPEVVRFDIAMHDPTCMCVPEPFGYLFQVVNGLL